MNNFGNNLRRLRTEAGLSQRELAEKLGYRGQSAVQMIESGNRHPAWEKVIKIADFFGVSIDEMMETPDLEPTHA